MSSSNQKKTKIPNNIKVLRGSSTVFNVSNVIIYANHSIINGDNCTVHGNHCVVNGNNCKVIGNHNVLNGSNSHATGNFNKSRTSTSVTESKHSKKMKFSIPNKNSSSFVFNGYAEINGEVFNLKGVTDGGSNNFGQGIKRGSKYNVSNLNGVIIGKNISNVNGMSVISDGISIVTENPETSRSELIQIKSEGETKTCKLCNKKKIKTINIPCEHYCLCLKCSVEAFCTKEKHLPKCQIYNQTVDEIKILP